jgi:tripartite-type tricarboxylate transporter receptor subunit TctC
MPLSKSSMLAASVAGLAITVSLARAQPYPSKAIRMVVPFPPGGPNDILGRLIAQRLTAQLGQQVVIDNRGGAGGIIGAELAARAVADGYTLLFGGHGAPIDQSVAARAASV